MEKKEMKKLIKWYCFSFLELPNKFKNDKEIVLMAVQRNGNMLKYASDKLRSNKEIVLAAIKKSDGLAIKYAGDELKNDKEMALAAIKYGWRSLEYISKSLRNDSEIAISAVKKSGIAYVYCGEIMQRDRRVINLANKYLKLYKQSVEDYLCNELKELKRKYNAKTLDIALDMEIADIEFYKLNNDNGVNLNKKNDLLKIRM